MLTKQLTRNVVKTWEESINVFVVHTHTNTRDQSFPKLHCSYLLHSTCYRCCHLCVCVCVTHVVGCISSKKDVRMQGWHSVLRKGSEKGVGRLWDRQQGFCSIFLLHIVFFLRSLRNFRSFSSEMVSFTFPQFPAPPPEWYIWLRASQDSLRVPWPLSWWRQARWLDRRWLPAHLSDTQWLVQGGGSKIGWRLCYQWCRWNPGTWWPSFSQAVRWLDGAFCHPHAKGTGNIFLCCYSNV